MSCVCHCVLRITDALSLSLSLSSVYLASMAVINGAKSLDEIIKTVKAGFFSVLRVCDQTTCTCVWGLKLVLADFLGRIPHFNGNRSEISSRRGTTLECSLELGPFMFF